MLLVMPLQGVAASLSHLLCSPPSAAEQMVSGHHHDVGGDNVTPHDHDDSSSNDSSKSHAGHLSCHQVSSAIPSVTVAVFVSNLSVFEPAVFILSSLFFPERPQRPPR
ncbi:MAG: hypothetical protein K2Y16_11295 [Burkholderiales bacterium]|nr:hypothetical protein [Burkholderiales bacterium]